MKTYEVAFSTINKYQSKPTAVYTVCANGPLEAEMTATGRWNHEWAVRGHIIYTREIL